MKMKAKSREDEGMWKMDRVEFVNSIRDMRTSEQSMQ